MVLCICIHVPDFCYSSSHLEGTSDEHIAVVENISELNLDGAVVVTTPQGVALADVRRELSFCVKLKLPILGVVENMSGYICPHCKVYTHHLLPAYPYHHIDVVLSYRYIKATHAIELYQSYTCHRAISELHMS